MLGRVRGGLDYVSGFLPDGVAVRLSVCALDGAAGLAGLIYFGLLLIGLAASAGWCIRSLVLDGGSNHPIFAVFAVLGSTIGLPFLVLGTTSPLMQVWWARLHGTAIPYRLFALSNLASFWHSPATPR